MNWLLNGSIRSKRPRISNRELSHKVRYWPNCSSLKKTILLSEHENKNFHTDLYTINVVTIIDKFSRFACGYTIPARDAVNVVGTIRRFIVAYGIPKKIVYDQGAEYNSNHLKDFCQQYTII